jgi:hypothetical protein
LLAYNACDSRISRSAEPRGRGLPLRGRRIDLGSGPPPHVSEPPPIAAFLVCFLRNWSAGDWHCCKPKTVCRGRGGNKIIIKSSRLLKGFGCFGCIIDKHNLLLAGVRGAAARPRVG